ncbi:hypothetical protein BOTCAL_0050g00160 [Botryotinia calthae]|uniref:Uncharacterized protein n=1 Tax=Botryotinia calthae TaxID=38488 RepID=A0A4Y8DB05_9HELO|nr:hypothetical protein BOTCAL_0050g00160 [Botryotinia calthae]
MALAYQKQDAIAIEHLKTRHSAEQNWYFIASNEGITYSKKNSNLSETGLLKELLEETFGNIGLRIETSTCPTRSSDDETRRFYGNSGLKA